MDREKALELMDALLKEGFTVKMWAYRVHKGRPTDIMDKRTWDGGCSYEIVVDAGISLRDAMRVQSVVDPLGYEAWIGSDSDSHPAIKIEMGLRGRRSE